jgi:O-methyltransferase
MAEIHVDRNGAERTHQRHLARAIRGVIHRLGFDIVRFPPPAPAEPSDPPDFDAPTAATIRLVRPYTMTSVTRLHALCHAIRYVVRHGIPGDIVECGVWRGGSIMAAARTLMEAGDVSRHLYLFDTFEGMVQPEEQDVRHDGVAALTLMTDAAHRDTMRCLSTLDEVKHAMALVGYPEDRVHYVRGAVEDTLPRSAPDRIALLRLDTDWYRSTQHELRNLVPRISSYGVLIIDDYGHWLGCRRAVDEFVQEYGLPLLLNRIDETGRMAIVP